MTDELLRLECLKLATKSIVENGVRGFGELQDKYWGNRIEREANRFFKYIKEGFKEEEMPPCDISKVDTPTLKEISPILFESRIEPVIKKRDNSKYWLTISIVVLILNIILAVIQFAK